MYLATSPHCGLLVITFICLLVNAHSFTFPISRSIASSVYSGTNIRLTALDDFDYTKESELPWLESGYETWNWRGHNINFVDIGHEADKNKPPLLLVHGFGASVYHWRYNIPELARKYHVYAIDMLGFGLSDKPIIDYDAEVWRDQVLDFIYEVVMQGGSVQRDPCVVAGNSLGGFTALYAAASAAAAEKNLIGGCILLNGAGRFKPLESVEEKQPNPVIKSIADAFQRFVINLSFFYTKQPARIEQVLRQVYPVDDSNVNAKLVESIRFPAQNPNAAEVFFRVISKNGNGPPVFIDDLLANLKVPLLLLWGAQDPWIRPQAADKIQQLYPSAQRVNVDAGHCPHDEAPAAVNAAICEFMSGVRSSSQTASIA